MSIIACKEIAAWSCKASRTRGVKDRCLPRMLPPSGPVTSSQSPGRAPLRRTGPGGTASPRSVTEMTSGPSQLLVSPPTRAVSKASARSRRPRYNSSAKARPPCRGSPTLTTAATGLPAMAAISLRLTAIAFRPTSRGPASARRKQLPSSSMSVVTRQGACAARRSTAASSPGPISTRGSAGVRLRSQSM